MLLKLAMAIAFLAGATDVKIGDIQIVEFVVVGGLFMALLTSRSQLRLEGPAVVLDTLPRFLLLMLFLFLSSLLSMRLQLYPVPNTGLLKQPPFASFVRLIQIGMSISTMFIVALAIGTQPGNLKKIFSAYIWAAYISAIWGIVSLIGWLGGIELPGAAAGTIPRVRGFFVEGGPFGLYLVSALLVQVVRYHFLHYISRRSFLMGSGLLLLGLAVSQSKSAIVLLLLLTGVYLVLTKRASAMLLLTPLLVPLVLTSNIVEGVSGYLQSRDRFAVLAHSNPQDYNLVMGRVMASVLLPRIVEEHPVLGVGIGNYSLVRNDPSLLRGLPRVGYWDLPSLGLLGYVAELGIPLTLYLLYIYVIPFLRARRARPWIGLLAIFPLGAAVFGVQLNFAYPWVVMGMALAALAIEAKGRRPAADAASGTLPDHLAALPRPLSRNHRA